MSDDDWFYFWVHVATLATIFAVVGVGVLMLWLLELGRFS